jgi:RNA polymerase sigma-70 factor (ECF subfamily)
LLKAREAPLDPGCRARTPPGAAVPAAMTESNPGRHWMSTDERTPAPRLDARLVAAAITGDRTAVDRLLADLRPLVLRYCRGRLGSSFGAEDCAQETMVAVLLALPRYRYETDSFLSFVFGIAAHKVADVYRRHSRDLSEPFADLGDTRAGSSLAAPDEYARTDARLQIGELLSHLPPLHRDLLTLRVILGFTAEETAEALGLPSAVSVRVAQHRSLSKLRQLMNAKAANQSE